jgi:CHAD domain-containing protein
MKAVSRNDKSPLEGARRVLVEQLRSTRSALAAPPLSDAVVHAIRKDLKRVRAGLRLLREPLGDKAYRRLNRTVRNAARPLTPVRDAKVMLQLFDRVLSSVRVGSPLGMLGELRDSLQGELNRHRVELKSDQLHEMCNRLNVVERSLRRLSRSRLRRADLNVALKNAHKKARGAFKCAIEEPSDETLHEWRKQVKYEASQLELLQPLNPKKIGPIVRRAQKLGDHLGDDHDLAILCDWIDARSRSCEFPALAKNRATVLEELNPRRMKSQRDALRLGASLNMGRSRVSVRAAR